MNGLFREIILGTKLTSGGDWSHEIKSHEISSLWKKSYDQPRWHIKMQKHYFADKGMIVNAMILLIIMYRCENWTVKKAECQRIDTLKL